MFVVLQSKQHTMLRGNLEQSHILKQIIQQNSEIVGASPQLKIYQIRLKHCDPKRLEIRA